MKENFRNTYKKYANPMFILLKQKHKSHKSTNSGLLKTKIILSEESIITLKKNPKLVFFNVI